MQSSVKESKSDQLGKKLTVTKCCWLSLSLPIYVYIYMQYKVYIYIYVCVCVCVCGRVYKDIKWFEWDWSCPSLPSRFVFLKLILHHKWPTFIWLWGFALYMCGLNIIWPMSSCFRSAKIVNSLVISVFESAWYGNWINFQSKIGLEPVVILP